MTASLTIRPVTADDMPAISALHRVTFGPGRFTRTAYRVREGTGLYTPHCRAATIDDKVVAALRFTPITIGGKGGALLLGPIAVDPGYRGRGHGHALISHAIGDAARAGFAIILLVGDLPFYGRFNFKPVPPGQILLPGPVNPARLLALELAVGALQTFRGLVSAT
jgi:predicted N-acetyltransferase YhbS